MLKSASVREIFDEMSLNVTAFLEGHQGVSKLTFVERGPVTSVDISSWESKHLPCVLPDDLKALLQITDGITLKWDANLHDETVQLGCMNLNHLSKMVEIPLDLANESAWIEVLMGQGGVVEGGAPETLACASSQQLHQCRELRSKFRAFDLDDMCTNGRVALLYVRGPQKPQVWFQDLAGQWFFMSRCFSDYFRLLVMHLGLPNWQYALTDVGLDEQTKQWLRFLSPERLSIDIEHQGASSERRRIFRGQAPAEPRAAHRDRDPDPDRDRDASNADLPPNSANAGWGSGGGGTVDGGKRREDGVGVGLDLEKLDKSALLNQTSKGLGQGNTKTSASSKKKSAGIGGSGIGGGGGLSTPPVGAAGGAGIAAGSGRPRPSSAKLRP